MIPGFGRTGFGRDEIDPDIMEILESPVHLGVSENRLNPIVPNGFADHYPVFKWLAIIGNIRIMGYINR